MNVRSGETLIVAICEDEKDMIVECMTVKGFSALGIHVTKVTGKTHLFPYYSQTDWYASGYSNGYHVIMVKQKHQLDAAIASEQERRTKNTEEHKVWRRKQIQDKIDVPQKELNSIV